MTISADDYLARPIDSLIFWAAHLVKRIETHGKLPEETRESDFVKALMEKDEQMRKAYLVALRIRAKEVEAYALQHGYRLPADWIKENPFLVCFGLMYRAGVFKDEEDD